MDAKPNLILVDDEERILRSLAMLFRTSYNVQATVDANHALELVGRGNVHVIVSDQKMPIMRGADLLRQVKERSPNTMRILLTGYSELDAVIASVNEGEIFRFINKPWDADELRSTVAQAAEISNALFVTPAVATPAEVAASTAAAILVIDDDADVVQAVREIVPASQPVLWAKSLDAAMGHLESQEIGVIVSELIVGNDSIGTFLKLLKAEYPQIVTIVLTPLNDAGIFINLINQGQVYRLLPKPLRRGPFGRNLGSALRHHQTLKASPRLRMVHAVQTLRAPQPDEASVATRVMGFLGRLRTRSVANV